MNLGGSVMKEENATTKTKKAWYKRWWAIAIYIIVGLGIISSLGGEDKTDTQAPTTTENQTAPATQAPTTTLPPTTTTTKQKQWVKVIELSGSANKRSQVFELTGGQTKLSYVVKGNTMPLCSIYVMEEGTSLQESGGFPEVMIQQAGSDTTYLNKGPGRYYLDINSANCSWTVTIEEER